MADAVVSAQPLHYAGFWRRFIAAMIDGIILGAVLAALDYAGLQVLKDKPLYAASSTAVRVGVDFTPLGTVIGLALWWLYHAVLESSGPQATIGKMALSIKVTDADGARITFWRATGRTWAKLISAFILMIGYIMAAFTRRKQALHDIITDCLVVKGRV